MNLSFLFLLGAAGIFRFLAEDAKKAFKTRLAACLPRNVVERHLQVFLTEFHQHFSEFRRRILPFFALHIVLNAAACGMVVFALWYTPPEALPAWALIFMRYSCLIVVPLALVADTVIFSKVLIATFGRPLSLEDPEP